MANKNSNRKNRFKNKATVGSDGTVSVNTRRNMAMRVYTNVGADGKKFSVTAHEPIGAGFVTFKNHGYMREDERGNNNYRQPVG